MISVSMSFLGECFCMYHIKLLEMVLYIWVINNLYFLFCGCWVLSMLMFAVGFRDFDLVFLASWFIFIDITYLHMFPNCRYW